ncbi:uncharacterized protein L203_102276 [Cryptococcus depauperatus CBS 7841]|uniref:Uncharacterized protein n=1 Tax=Cryptococcus depauperatus CBS 7841 TaxID=1295531 RepID=A0AAJ8LZJ2_9TREE
MNTALHAGFFASTLKILDQKPPSRLAQSTFLASEHQTLSVAYTPDQTLGDPASIKHESLNFMIVTSGMPVRVSLPRRWISVRPLNSFTSSCA